MGKVVSAGLTISGLPYGDIVQAGDLVGWSGGQLVKACGVAGDPIPAVGIAAAGYRPGDVGAMHLMGVVSGFASLGEGNTQYLSLSVAGGVQQTIPSGAGALKQVVGFAVAPDQIAMVLRDEGVLM